MRGLAPDVVSNASNAWERRTTPTEGRREQRVGKTHNRSGKRSAQAPYHKTLSKLHKFECSYTSANCLTWFTSTSQAQASQRRYDLKETHDVSILQTHHPVQIKRDVTLCLLVPHGVEATEECLPHRDGDDVLEQLLVTFLVAALKLVAWNSDGEMVNVMVLNAERDPLQARWDLQFTAALQASIIVDVAMIVVLPVARVDLMLQVEQQACEDERHPTSFGKADPSSPAAEVVETEVNGHEWHLCGPLAWPRRPLERHDDTEEDGRLPEEARR